MQISKSVRARRIRRLPMPDRVFLDLMTDARLCTLPYPPTIKIRATIATVTNRVAMCIVGRSGGPSRPSSDDDVAGV